MKEANLNTIIRNSIGEGGFAYKLPDPQGAMVHTVSELPFDGFGLYKDQVIYWEAKFLKGYQAFNFKRIADHQWKNLILINRNCRKFELMNVNPIFIVGVWEPRNFFDLYAFHADTLSYYSKLHKSILKKELLELKEAGLHTEIKKQMFDVDELLEKLDLINCRIDIRDRSKIPMIEVLKEEEQNAENI